MTTTITVPARSRVVVVDDDVQVGEALAEALRMDGHEVSLFSAATGALAQLSAHGGDILVLDVFMPGFDGFEVMRALRGLAAPPRVLVISGGREEMLRAAALLGADAVLAKPFGPGELVLRVRELLQRPPA